MPEPDLQDNDVLVRIHAAAVNLLDSKVRDAMNEADVALKPKNLNMVGMPLPDEKKYE